MKRFHFTTAVTVLLSLIALPAFGGNPHPYDDPAINFQGRLEVGEIGYSGAAWFRFSIGNENFSSLYWSGWCETSCVEGIYNVILGRDTNAMTDAVFNHQDSYYLRVAFSTNGQYFETLSPDQEMIHVPFAVNADLLDGLESPGSAFVGLTDTQTMTNKTLTDPTLTRPVIDSTYFFVTPGTLPANPAEGYFGYDDSTDSFKYYDGAKWVAWGESTASTNVWTRTGSHLSPSSAGDDVSLGTNENLIYTWNGSATNLLIALNNATKAGIYQAGNDQIDFATQSTQRFSIRGDGQSRFVPLAADPNNGGEGDLYYNSTDDTFKYYKNTTWHPIASGTGSIMNPIGTDCTLRGSDGTTWVATTGFLIRSDGTATVQKDIRIRQKMYFYGDSNTYLQGDDQDTLEFYTGGALTMTLTPDQRLRMAGQGTRLVPAVSFGNQSHLGIYADSTNNHISFAGNQTDMFSIRGQGHVRFRPLGEAPATGVSRSGDLYFNAQTGTFMYYHGGWKAIASGEGSIPKPNAQYDTLYASDSNTWAPTDHLRVYPHEKVTTRKDLQVGWSTASDPKILFGTSTTNYITSPVAGIFEFYSGGARSMRITGNLTSTGDPLVSFSADSSGISRPAPNNLGLITGGVEALRIRANQQVGLGTGASTSARLHVNETADQRAFRLDQRSNNYAAFINQTGQKSAVWIDQGDNTSMSESSAPSATVGGALHVYMAHANATGSAITAYSARNNAVAPLVWFKGATDYNNQVLLRLEPRLTASSAPPLHLVPQESIVGTFNTLTGAVYVNLNGNLYYNNGTNWIALTGDSGAGGGPAGSDKYVQFNDGGSFGGDSAFTFHSVTKLLTVSQITTGSGATITEFSTDTTLGDTSDTAVPTEKAVKEYVDERVSSAGGVGGTGTADQVAYWTGTTTISGDGGFTYADATDTLTITTISPTTINAFSLGGTLTGGANIISGTAFDIDGGTIDAITSLTVANNVDIGSYGLTALSLTADGLAANRVVITGAGGTLAVDGDLQFDGTDTLTATKITTGTGATITEFSTDTTLSGGDVEVPTELAVKTYVDDAILDGTGTFASGTGADTYLTYWINQTTISGEAALIYDDATDKVTLTSGATTGEALQIVANAVTSGKALEVTSSGVGGTEDALVYIERTGAGRALQVKTNNPTASGVWFEAQTMAGGRVLTVKSNQSGMTGSGYVLHAIQDHASASGHALVGQQDGTGNAVRAIVSAGAPAGANALFVNQGSDSDTTVTQTTGGALHIDNTGNNYGGLTVFSGQTSPQAAPLATIKSTSISFDQALLYIDPAITGNAPHLYLKAIDGPTPESVAAGMIYMDTDGYLKYYNGANWLALTGSAGGAGDFALRDLSNITGIAAGLIPDGNNTRDLGSAAASWKDLHIDGTATIATAAISGGTIINTTIGLTGEAAAKFTSLTAATVALSADGSAATPAITWAGDVNTGFYRIGADQIGVSTAGTLQATFDASGHFILSQNGSNTNPIISLGGETNTGIYQAADENIDFTNIGTRMFSMRSSGVFRLVGTAAAPAAAASNAGGIFWDNDDNSLMYSDGAKWITLTGPSPFSGSGAAGQAAFWSSATQVTGENNFFWDAQTDRLGIRTNSPGLPLDVRGSWISGTTTTEDIIRVASTSANPLELRLGLGTHATVASRYGYIDAYDGGAPAGPRHLVLQKDGGYVGIGTTSPRNFLDISQINTLPLNLESLSTTAGDVTGVYFRVHSSGDNNRKGAIIFERTGSFGRGSIHLATENTGDATNVSKTNARLTVTSGGQVGVGTTGPNANTRMSVAGTSGSLAHLYLNPVAFAVTTAAEGMLYSSSTTKSLLYYNGTDWIALTGSAGGAGDFATRALNNLAGVAVNTALLPAADNTIDLGSADYSWANLYVDGTANIATAAISGGTINSSTIGLTTAAAGAFTTLTAANATFTGLTASIADINGGTIDVVTINESTIGLTTPAAGTFTNLTATTAYLSSGTTINEFSTDGTLAGNSDAAVPTEQAVKTYVDNRPIGAGINGSGLDTQVTYWTNESTIAGDAGMTYDAAGDRLTVVNATFTGLTAALADINGGTIDGVTINSSTIGLTQPGAAEFTTMTADIVALDATGSAAAPAITWEADPNTGIYRNIADNLVFATGGVEKLRIYSTEGGAATNPLLQLSADANTGFFHPADDEIAISGGGTETIRFDAANYVGIGTAAAIDAKLHVLTATVNALHIDQDGAFEGILVDQDGNECGIRIDQDGNTRTSAPTDTDGGALHIGNSGNEGPALTVYSTFANQSTGNPLVWLRATSTWGGVQSDMAVLRIETTSGKAAHMYLEPVASPLTNSLEGMIYADTDGTLYYRSNTSWQACNAIGDFAEILEAVNPHNEYEIGDVIVQSTVPLCVDRSDLIYANNVVGVVAERTIKMLYDLPENEYKIAVGLLGLVSCKVTNEGGPIMPGDKLVTSSTPGYAMKADLERLKGWQIVGTAREPFDGDQGLIEIMVGK